MDVVLWWHLHQPDYREPAGDIAGLPWVRMHALRAYTDLPAFLLQEGPIGMTINVVPSLADQLEDLATGRVLDRHYRLAMGIAEGHDEAVPDAFRLHAAPAPRPMLPLPRLDELRAKCAAHGRPNAAEARDACVLFHLSWVGFRAFTEPGVQELFRKGRDFLAEDLRYLLELSRRMAADVLPRLREARERGVCHLTCTPYYHPILPLLIDTRSAHEATRDRGAPLPFGSPADAALQVRHALSRHQALFGESTRAMWPAEGSLSEAALELLAANGVTVVASDEALLRKSLAACPDSQRRLEGISPGDAHLHAWRHEPTGMNLLFRDRRLSDDWGFVYRELSPQDAGEAFVAGVQARAARGGSVSAVILDGENPFEHYPHAGREHLLAFARATRGRVHFSSPEEATSRRPRPLTRLATGSWIDASFDIWAGDDEDRRAWALLAEVHALVEGAELSPEAARHAREHLLAAEGSDWFWWYGPEFPIADRPRFDHLFRQHLMAALDAAGLSRDAVPALRLPVLDTRRRTGGRKPLALGHVRDTAEPGAPWRWVNAATARADAGQGSMHLGAPLISEVSVLASATDLAVRVRARSDVDEAEVHLRWRHEHRVVTPAWASHAADERCEVVLIPWSDLPVPPGDPVEVFVQARVRGSAGTRLPDGAERRLRAIRPGPWVLEA